MLCYRDRSYCSSPGCKDECGRQFKDEDAIAAERWWGGPDYPVSMMRFCNDEGVPLHHDRPKPSISDDVRPGR